MENKMQMMQEKFLMLADKLWVESDIIKNISEWFEKIEEKMEEKIEEKRDIDVDITKPHKTPMPSEEEIDKMEKEELLAFAKSVIKTPAEDKPRADGQENSPFVVMMKKQGY